MTPRRVLALVAVIGGALLVALAVRLVPSQNCPLASVSCRLKWHHQAQFAGFYLAQSLGFFEDEGIQCDLRPGGPDLNALALVATGSEEFGVWGAESVLIGRSQGMPVVAVAVLFQESPVCFFVRRDSAIQSPRAFAGQTVAMQYGTNVRIEYVAMMQRLGVPLSAVTETPSRFDMQRFMQGEVPVWNGYTINEPRVAERLGIPVRVFRPRDYGVNFYADCIITTERMIRERPDVVRGFVRAVLRGWRYALDHPDEAVEAVLRFDPRLDRTHQRDMLEATRELLLAGSASTAGLGSMDAAVWEAMLAELRDQDLLGRHNVDLRRSFTTDFLPKVAPASESSP